MPSLTILDRNEFKLKLKKNITQHNDRNNKNKNWNWPILLNLLNWWYCLTKMWEHKSFKLGRILPHSSLLLWTKLIIMLLKRGIWFVRSSSGSDRNELWKGQRITTFQTSEKTLIDMKVIRPLRYKNIAYNVTQRTSFDDILSDEVEDFIYQILREHNEMEPSVQHKAMVLVSNKDIAEERKGQVVEKVARY